MTNKILADMGANVWKVLVNEGDHLDEGDTIMILESMKMEIPIMCEDAGTVTHVHVAEGSSVEPGQLLVEVDE
jgi:acetyl-CoA carboxylase biotin carboxyl carrier protein